MAYAFQGLQRSASPALTGIAERTRAPSPRTARLPAADMDPIPAADRLAGTAAILAASPRVRRLSALGELVNSRADNAVPIQLRPQRVTGAAAAGGGQELWFTPDDPDTHFTTRAAAQAHEDSLQKQRVEKQEREREAARQAAREKREQDRQARFAAMAPHLGESMGAASGTARLHKGQGTTKDSDMLPVHPMTPPTAKTKMNAFVELSRLKKLDSALVRFGHSYYFMQQGRMEGQDLSLTATQIEPRAEGDSADSDMPQLRRVGGARRTADFASPLDGLAQRLLPEGGDITAVYKRMGKDIDRLSRGSPVLTGPGGLAYDVGLGDMQELAAILRVDKGRVPEATKYIRRQLTSGLSFNDLLARNQYVGAPAGGTKALGGKVESGGEESEGSDIEGASSRTERAGQQGSRRRRSSSSGSEADREGEAAPAAAASAAVQEQRSDDEEKQLRKKSRHVSPSPNEIGQDDGVSASSAAAAAAEMAAHEAARNEAEAYYAQVRRSEASGADSSDNTKMTDPEQR